MQPPRKRLLRAPVYPDFAVHTTSSKKGFEVVVLEAVDRSGGHILSVRDGLDDGLYTDGGAEHFYRPGYDQLWTYIDEMQLPVIAYPRRRNLLTRIGNRSYTKEELSAPSMLGEQGYNQREIEYIRKNSIYDFPGLYYAEYIDRFADEYKPFETKFAGLDSITLNDLLRNKGASPAATASLGGNAWPGSNQSALQAVWHAAIRRKRHMAWVQLNLFRIRGGNQRLTDALAARLGHRLRLACPLTASEHSPGGVRFSTRAQGRRCSRRRIIWLLACPSPICAGFRSCLIGLRRSST
jgi:monoamine oxidase